MAAFSYPTPTPTPQPSKPSVFGAADTRIARKSSFVISLLGDSMIDTLGPDGGNLASFIKQAYPSVNVSVINHGVGAENINSGLQRLSNGYAYLGQNRNSVISEKPDIIILESFGYNPYPLPDMTDALNRHWLKMAHIVDIIKRELPDTRIVIAATIAPNWDIFGDGAAGLNFSTEGKRTKVQEIKHYIENAIKFAESQRLPLADAYTPSMDTTGNGNLVYINAGDHIHYSEAGRTLFAQTVARTIITNRLLE